MDVGAVVKDELLVYFGQLLNNGVIYYLLQSENFLNNPQKLRKLVYSHREAERLQQSVLELQNHHVYLLLGVLVQQDLRHVLEDSYFLLTGALLHRQCLGNLVVVVYLDAV